MSHSQELFSVFQQVSKRRRCGHSFGNTLITAFRTNRKLCVFQTFKTVSVLVSAESNKKSFQSNANRQITDNPYFIVNKFEHAVRESEGSMYSEVQVKLMSGRGPSTVRSKLNKSENAWLGGPYTVKSKLSLNV